MKKTTLYSLLILLVLGFGACTKNFTEMNTNPNSPTDAPAINIFTHAADAAVGEFLGGWLQHTYLGNWSQQWCKIQYIDEDKYLFRPANINGFFQDPYENPLMDLKIIMEKTAELDRTIGQDGLNSAARILKAWIFAQQTDNFGDIPYFDALKGLEDVIFPAYDKQEDIYMDILAELEDCNTVLKDAYANFGEGDIIYGGDPAKWRKFANSLRLRLLNRCSDVYGDADAKIAEILNNPGDYPLIETNDCNCKLDYPGVVPYRNPIYSTLYTRTDQAISQTMVNWLKDREDPRLPVYAQPRELDGEYVGQQNGAAKQPKINERSLLGIAIAYTPDAPVFLMHAAEVEFLKAEYYARTGGDAQTHYEQGIRENLEMWGVTADVDAYLAHDLVAFDAAKQFEQIADQKWAAIFGQGVEAYAEVRRTGYPARIFEYELEATAYPDMGLPVRLPYPANEESFNGANLAAAKERQGVPSTNDGMFGAQMWWHTKVNPVPTEIDPQDD